MSVSAATPNRTSLPVMRTVRWPSVTRDPLRAASLLLTDRLPAALLPLRLPVLRPLLPHRVPRLLLLHRMAPSPLMAVLPQLLAAVHRAPMLQLRLPAAVLPRLRPLAPRRRVVTAADIVAVRPLVAVAVIPVVAAVAATTAVLRLAVAVVTVVAATAVAVSPEEDTPVAVTPVAVTLEVVAMAVAAATVVDIDKKTKRSGFPLLFLFPKQGLDEGRTIEELQVGHLLAQTYIANRYLELLADADYYATLCGTIQFGDGQ